MSDSLLHRVATGDQAALEAFMDRFGALVWSLARRFTRDRSDAEDLMGWVRERQGLAAREKRFPMKGTCLSIYSRAVNSRSRVLVAIGEGAAGGADNGKFIGAARYTVHNVAPRAGGVDIWVNIEWSADIALYVDYLVINP